MTVRGFSGINLERATLGNTPVRKAKALQSKVARLPRGRKTSDNSTTKKIRKYCAYLFVLLSLIPLTARAQSLAVCPLPSESWLTAEFFGDSAQATWRDGSNNLHMLMGRSPYSAARARHVQHKSGSTPLASVMDYPTDSSTAADLSSVTCNSAYTYDCNPNQYSSHWRHVWPEAVDWD